MAKRRGGKHGPAGKHTPVRPSLDQEDVVEAALKLLDEVGLEGLTTRRLADRLGIRSPSLYWHFRDKDELLQLLAERIARDVPLPDACLHWRGRLEALMSGFRLALHAHRDAALLFTRTVPAAPNLLTIAETAIRALLDGGLSDDDALGAVGILVAFVIGFAIDEAAPAAPIPGGASYASFIAALPHSRYPELTRLAGRLERVDRDRQFTYAVAVLLDGLQRPPMAGMTSHQTAPHQVHE